MHEIYVKERFGTANSKLCKLVNKCGCERRLNKFLKYHLEGSELIEGVSFEIQNMETVCRRSGNELSTGFIEKSQIDSRIDSLRMSWLHSIRGIDFPESVWEIDRDK